MRQIHNHLSSINKVIKGTELPNSKILKCAQSLIAQQVKILCYFKFKKIFRFQMNGIHYGQLRIRQIF